MASDFSRYVVNLDDALAQDPSHSGSKGANLARMMSAGLPVPSGFVISTYAFSQAAKDAMPFLTETISGLNQSDLNTLERASTLASEAILSCPLPAEVGEAIQQAYDALGGIPVSVRSSATAEDLAGASFAGMYSSFLNVLTLKDIKLRIQDVWASLYSPQAVAYSLRYGLPHHNARMAVVVQKQLDPTASGVMFTRDPITGTNRFVVNAAFGLGEGVVAGTAATDNFTIDPSSSAVISSNVVTKDKKVVPNALGGTTMASVETEHQSMPALTETTLQSLVALGQRTSDLLDSHLDIEFAVQDNEVHLLQARPATAIAQQPDDDVEWESGVDPEYGWIRHPNFGRGPLFRLEEEAARRYFRYQQVCHEETGSPRSALHFTEIVNGCVYARPPEVDPNTMAARHAKHKARVEAYEQQGTSYFEGFMRPYIERDLRRLKKLRPSKPDLKAHLHFLDQCMEAHGYVLGHLHWCQRKPGPRPDWHAEYAEMTGGSPQEANVFLQAVENRTTRLIKRIRKLARMAQSDSTLSDLMLGRRFDELTSGETKNSPCVQGFMNEFKRMLGIFGLRTGRGFGSGTRFNTPTWNIEPKQALEIVASYVEQDLDRIDRLEEQARQERRNAVRRIRRRLTGDPDTLARFNDGLASALVFVRQMENHNYYMEQGIYGMQREAVHAMGEALVAHNLIDEPDDVFHIAFDELQEIVVRVPDDLRALVRVRKDELERRTRMSAPQSLGDGPVPANPTNIGAALPEGVGRYGNVIRGTGASNGRATGIARVVQVGGAMPRVHPGDILVAVNVGPDWTPAFGIIGGLVLDQGALFQHAALVAREYRIPAVLQTRDATSAIRDGQTITVDGNAGTVELES